MTTATMTKAPAVSEWPQRMRRSQAQKYLGVSGRLFTELMESGQIPYIKYDERDRRSIRFDRDDLDQVMARKKRRMA